MSKAGGKFFFLLAIAFAVIICCQVSAERNGNGDEGPVRRRVIASRNPADAGEGNGGRRQQARQQNGGNPHARQSSGRRPSVDDGDSDGNGRRRQQKDAEPVKKLRRFQQRGNGASGGPFGFIIDILCGIPVLKDLLSMICSGSATTSTTAKATTASTTTTPAPTTAKPATNATTPTTTAGTTPAPVRAKLVRNGLDNNTYCLSYLGNGNVGDLIVVSKCNETAPKQGAFTVVSGPNGTAAFCISDTICDGIQNNTGADYSPHTNINKLFAKDLNSPAQQWTLHPDTTNYPKHFINGLTNKCAQAYLPNVDGRLWGYVATVDCQTNTPAQEWTVIPA